ncbi:MAG TPA: lipase family protein [Terriglobales bacterium]|nr:lipase family protein [Terriglobales bacterium]
MAFQPVFCRKRFLATLGISLAVTAAILSVANSAFAQAPAAAPVRPSQILHTLPLTKFYDTPHPLPGGKPGELIRSDSFDEYELPPEVSAVRILYHSRSASGEDVATSGVVLIPSEGRPPVGGWPVIAWAHGAAGVARACAPSLMRNVGHGPFLSMYVALGYAVVATDYTGLGTNFRNAFLDAQSNATDVIGSVSAARLAVPQVGARWIVIGEGEGSLAAVAVAEKQNEIRDPGYLGSIAISGLADAKEVFARSMQGPASSMFTFLAYGIKTVYPQFQATDMLTEKALPLYQQIQQNCAETAVAQLPPTETLRPGWDSNEFVKQYLARNTLGQTQARGAILVISADADRTVPATMAAPVIARMCKQGDRVQWERYPDLDPGRVIGDSARDQITWIEARFAGRPAPANCP